MPNVGTPVVSNSASTWGAPSAYTLDGPPDRMIALGRRAIISATGIVCGTISEYTFASRTRRAISCAYCAPKSTTSTRSCSAAAVTGKGYRGLLDQQSGWCPERQQLDHRRIAVHQSEPRQQRCRGLD